MNKLRIVDFTEYPGLRHCKISEASGEEYYHTILNEEFAKTVKDNAILQVDLDNTDGYASSFLDEAFGNLVYDFTLDIVKKHIQIISNLEPHWKKMLEEKTFIEWEKRRKKEDAPTITEDHAPWFRLVNGKLVKDNWVAKSN
ncbi:STAS-like domain-containing protein [Porphyromonadaceae bacterium W3.11]|nr:STAS-like domain-containing protein [Porphyromonadaceae bacterium W3.11]